MTKERPVYTETTECVYCGADLEGSEETINATPVPAVDSDEEWDIISERHFYGCEWVDSRAHRIEL